MNRSLLPARDITWKTIGGRRGRTFGQGRIVLAYSGQIVSWACNVYRLFAKVFSKIASLLLEITHDYSDVN